MSKDREISQVVEKQPQQENFIQHLWHEVFPAQTAGQDRKEKSAATGGDDYLPKLSIGDDSAAVEKKMAVADSRSAVVEKMAVADDRSAVVEKKKAAADQSTDNAVYKKKVGEGTDD